MKLFVAFATVVAVTVAVPISRVSPMLAGAAPIIEDVGHGPIIPAIVNTVPEPIAVRPAIIDNIVPEPIAVGPEIVYPAVINPAPAAGPLAQLIINVNAPVATQDKPQPIIVVDEAHNREEIEPEPVIDPVIPELVLVAEPVVIGTHIISVPAVVLPGDLN